MSIILQALGFCVSTQMFLWLCSLDRGALCMFLFLETIKTHRRETQILFFFNDRIKRCLLLEGASRVPRTSAQKGAQKQGFESSLDLWRRQKFEIVLECTRGRTLYLPTRGRGVRLNTRGILPHGVESSRETHSGEKPFDCKLRFLNVVALLSLFYGQER